MRADRTQELKSIITRSLNNAERIWCNHGLTLDAAMDRADSAVLEKSERVRARIPGWREVISGHEQVGTFIAFVVDIRESSRHLLCRIADAKATELERVLYETSALLPAVERTIEYEEGAVTEYLGDGLLAFFKLDKANIHEGVYRAFEAASNSLLDTRDMVNEVLEERYDLPPLNFGIGLAMSEAVVSLVGLEGQSHAKVIGRCVYNATKLATGRNEIIVDATLRHAWPTSKGGQLRFRKKVNEDVEGYVIARVEQE